MSLHLDTPLPSPRSASLPLPLSGHWGWAGCHPPGAGGWASRRPGAPPPPRFPPGQLGSRPVDAAHPPGRNPGDVAARGARQLEVSLAPASAPAGLQLTKIPGAHSNLLSSLLSAGQAQGGGCVWAAVSRSCAHSCGRRQSCRSALSPSTCLVHTRNGLQLRRRGALPPRPCREEGGACQHSWAGLTHLLGLAPAQCAPTECADAPPRPEGDRGHTHEAVAVSWIPAKLTHRRVPAACVRGRTRSHAHTSVCPPAPLSAAWGHPRHVRALWLTGNLRPSCAL